MDKIIVDGPCRLSGEVTGSGAKNAAVAILPATLLVNGKCHLENVPDISDIRAFIKILKSLGSKVEYITRNELNIIMFLNEKGRLNLSNISTPTLK